MTKQKKPRVTLPLRKNYFVSLLGGSEAGLATTSAIIVGLAITTENITLIVSTAFISLFVQAWNSAMSTISVERTVDQIDHPYSRTDHYLRFIQDGGIQFASHVFASLIPILPLGFVSDLKRAVLTSVGFTLTLLAIIGFSKARVIKRSIFRGMVEAIVTGGLVVTIGVIAGLLLRG